MNTFTDTNSRSWLISINYEAVERVLTETGFNLLSLVDPKAAAKLDAIKMLGVLFSLCGPQAKEIGITRSQFINSLSPDSVEVAALALETELINFSPSRLRPTLQKMAEKGQTLQAAAIQQANDFLDKVTPEQLLAAGRAEMEKILAQSSTEAGTSSQALSASTQADSRSAS